MAPRRTPWRRVRGVSLVEAVVALAVMAFGTLAVLGVQTTLRMNSDVAKQRSEALRIAQESLEDARAFATLDQYEAMDTQTAAVVGYTLANTTYQVTRTVVDAQSRAAELSPALPSRRKTLSVVVSWTDRTGQAQRVQLSSAINGSEPVLAGSLSIPMDHAVTAQPRGRHRAIPPAAVDVGGGKSRFDPPGGGGIGWVFNNTTGLIVARCTGLAPETCLTFDALLLAGYVRFATAAAAAPTPADTEVPPGFVEPLEVEVAQTLPAVRTVGCYEETILGAVGYYCAVPVAEMGAKIWSGRSLVRLPAARAFLAAEPVNPNRRRVCRYTPVREHLTAPTQIRNVDHPLDYVKVETSLVQQNFLVIRAGDGSTAYECPGDGPATWVNSNTWRHQPPS